MTQRYSKEFDKQFAGLSKTQKSNAIDAIELFLEKPNDASLRNHALSEKWYGYRSISADDDLRVHFKMIDNETVYFVAIGSHSQLYK
jgi:addiction module RelE/StbE family toxin